MIGFPVRDKVDEIALQLLRVLLRDEPCELEVLSPEMLSGERVARVETQRPSAVCLTSLPPGDLTALRQVCKRLRARQPEIKLIVGRLGAAKKTARSAELLRAAGAQEVISTLTELRDAVQRLVRELNTVEAVKFRIGLRLAALGHSRRRSLEPPLPRA